MGKIAWWNVDLGPAAVEAAANAVADRRISMGKLAQQLEGRLAEILRVPHVVMVPSGTMALTLALIEAGLQPGDEVIVPERTWIATANAPYLLGAKVVLCDVMEDKPLMSPEAFAKAITPRTKIVMPVHLNGRECDMPRIRAIAEQHGITVIEDACQGIFSKSREGGYVGTHAHSGCFSLAMTKPITCGQGGFVACRDSKVANRLRLIRNQGTDNIEDAHWQGVGGNFRFTDVLASIALSQLNRLEERLAAIHAVYDFYAANIVDSELLRLVRYDGDPGAIPLYPEVFVSERDKFVQLMESRGVQVRPVYPPVRSAPQFAQDGAFPNADKWAQTVFLPCGPDRRQEELAEIMAQVKNYISS